MLDLTCGFQVNTYTTSSQVYPAVAVEADGDFVVAWRSGGSGGTDGVTLAIPGGTLIYTIVALNAGPDAASAVSVTDTFPAALTCSWTSVAAGGATGNSSSSGDLADTVTMSSGSSVTYTVSCTIDPSATGALSNTASISSALIDPVPDNNSATDGDTALAPRAELSLVKAGPSAAGTSSTLPYNLRVSNGGPLAATSITLTDILPLGTSFVSLTAPGWACGELAGVMTCSRALLDPGSASNITVTLQTPPTASVITNSAQVSAAEIDLDPADNSASWTTAVAPAAIFSDGFESGDTSVWSTVP